MKMIRIAALAAVVMAGQAGFAQEVQTVETVHVWSDPQGWWHSHFTYDTATPHKFTANELSVDMFGSFFALQRGIDDLFETSIRNGTWGGGVGLNYFFTPYFGLSGDINIPDNDGKFVDWAQGSLVGRWPIEHVGLAPYIFGGGGRTTEPLWDWTRHVGVGLEWRMNPVTGLFTDARYAWADRLPDSLLIRAGIRLVF